MTWLPVGKRTVLKRVERVKQLISESGLDALIVTGLDNVRYLSGFTGSAGVLLVSAEKALLLTDSRYVTQALKEAYAFEVVKIEKTWPERLAGILRERDYAVLGFESEHVTHQQFLRLAEILAAVELRPVKDMVEGLRAVKDEAEIEKIRRAVSLVDEAFIEILDYVQAGRSELEIALELEFYLRNRGAKRMAFETIVASGARAALPHGAASGKQLEQGDLVIMDFGVVCDGYCSDFTRTVLVGTVPEPWQEEIFEVALEAQGAGIGAVRAGIPANEVDRRVREVIEGHGYGEYFGHGTGHGLGIGIHELPRLDRFSTETLEAGMVVTIEPGIYLPGRGGVRIEDVVVVRESGAEVLTGTPKDRLFSV